MVTSSYDDGGSVRPPHPDFDELADLAAGVNDDAAVRAHVDTCPECQQLLTDIAAAGATVAAELAALPMPSMPPDLVRRIDEAVAAERRSTAPELTAVSSFEPIQPSSDIEPDLSSAASTNSDDPNSVAAPSTVVPLADRQSFWRRHGGAVASSAAAAVVIAFAAVLVIGHFRGNDKPANTSPAAAAAQRTLPLVTASGVKYSTANLGLALPALLAHQPPGGSTELDATTGSGTVGTTGGSVAGATPSAATAPQSSASRLKAFSNPVPAASLPANLTALKTDSLALQQCLVNLEVAPSTLPLAVDLGLWSGQPAAVFVFPVPAHPDKIEVLIAPAGCPPGEVLFFQRFPRP